MDEPTQEQAQQQPLTQEALESVGSAAKQRWIDSGISQEQLAVLEQVRDHIADLDGTTLAYTEGSDIFIDRDAAGRGWFVDATPLDDAEFSGSTGDVLRANAGDAEGRMDLLTVLLHEQGHVLGLDHSGAPGTLMGGTFAAGERLLPADGQASGADPIDEPGAEFSHASLTLRTWTGAASNGLWNDAGNWSGGDVPDSVGEEALFSATAGGTINLGGSTVNVGALHFTAGSGTYVLQNGALNITPPVGTSSIVKAGNGIAQFDANLTITTTGDTLINGGTLRAQNLGTGKIILQAGVLSNNSTTARTLTNAVDLTANATIGSGTGGFTGSFTFNTGVVRLVGNDRTLTINNTATFNGQITNDGTSRTLTKAGGGTVVVNNGANNWGDTKVTAGTLALGNNNGIGTGGTLTLQSATTTNVTFRSNSTAALNLNHDLVLSGTNIYLGSSTTNGNITFNGNVSLAADAKIRVFQAVNFHGPITENVAGLDFGKGGVGTLTLNGSSNHSGDTRITEGIVGISHNNALGTATGDLSICNEATLRLVGWWADGR